MRNVSKKDVSRFLLSKLGLYGRFWPNNDFWGKVTSLGMLQLDSIRITGLRSHELSLLARAETFARQYEKIVYEDRKFSETHYPIHAVARDLVPMLITAFDDSKGKDIEGRKKLRPLMEWLLFFIKKHGPVTPRQFKANRIPGGFSTVKATTKALEFLFYDREIQICKRTTNFQRIFDLSERVAPELTVWKSPDKETYEHFLVQSALLVLKIATAEQIADRVRIHYGSWRKGFSIKQCRAIVDAYLKSGQALPVKVSDISDQPVYWYDPADEDGWERQNRYEAEYVRVIPPLDNLLFARKRFRDLFGIDYIFEAYKPKSKRRFYYGMPVLFDTQVVGILDACSEGEIWTILAVDAFRSVSADALRNGVHRIAAAAQAKRVSASSKVDKIWKKILVGDCL
jgi:hypothetical protein